MDTTVYAPLLGGNYADPSIIRVGNNYYMTHSSYKLTPGLVIWHSSDLSEWKPVAAALEEYLGDVWAPDFAEHNGTYYIYFPANRSNWVVTAPHPTGPWGKPINLGIKGIDPGHVVEPDGKRYLHMSGGEIIELSDDGLSVVGESRKVYEGWRYPDDWVVEAYSLEGPKVTFHNGYYYLTVAVGGTAGPPTSHMAASSRSRTPWGPWEHSPYNPIIHTESAAERWWSKGHGSLIDSPDGRWWMVYHAYLAGFHTLGRQTLIEPVEWTEDGWFRIAPSVMEPRPASTGAIEDAFDGPGLGLHWQCEGEKPETRFRPGPDGLTVEGAEQGSPLLFMPMAESYTTEVEVRVEWDAAARLMLYYNDAATLGLELHAGGVRHYRSFKGYGTMANDSGKAWLRIVNDRHIVSFYYSFDGEVWSRYDKVVDASGLHHNTFGGFQSLRIGLDVAGQGRAIFRRFSYRALEH